MFSKKDVVFRPAGGNILCHVSDGVTRVIMIHPVKG